MVWPASLFIIYALSAVHCSNITIALIGTNDIHGAALPTIM